MFKSNHKYFIFQIAMMLLLSSFSISAQNQITISEYLNSIKESEQVKIDSNTVSLLNDYNYNLPIIKSAQFRTETNDLVLERQEYTFRLKPNSIRAMSDQKELYQKRIEAVIVKNQLGFNEDLKDRYILILNYYFSSKLIDLYKEKQIQLEDKLNILSHSIYEIKFDVEDLIDAEDDLLETNLKLIMLEESSNNQLALLKQSLNYQGDSLVFNFDDFISPSEIYNVTIQDTIPTEPLNITLQKLKMYTLENEMELTAAKSKQILDYVQARYAAKKNDIFDESFSLGLGINLPFFGNTRSKKGEYYLKIINEESKLSKLKSKNIDNNKIVNEEFKTAKINYQILQKQNEESSINLLLDTYKKMEGAPPLQLVNLKVLQNKKNIEVLKSKHELYKIYIITLAYQEVLFQKPLINYLSSTKELIDP